MSAPANARFSIVSVRFRQFHHETAAGRCINMDRAPGNLSLAAAEVIVMQMTTTSSIDKLLLAKARQLTGLRGNAAVLNAGLEALIARESGRALSALGGSERSLRPARRRREKPQRGRG
jgi:hypothetical protein